MYSYVSEVLSDNPHGYWRLNDPVRTSGATAVDLTGRGHDGTYQGTVTATTNANGDPGGASSFDGLTGYVDTGLVRRYLEGVTIELWMRADALPVAAEANGPLHQGAPYSITWDHLEPAQRAVWRVQLDGVYHDIQLAGVTAGEYHHIVATWSGSRMTLVVDGELVGDITAIGALNLELLAWRIARHARDSVPGFWGGDVHDVAIYEGVGLSLERIRVHRQAMLSPVVLAGTARLDGFGDDTVSLSVHVPSGGSPPYTYQWERRAGAGAWEELSGQTALDCLDDTASGGTTYVYRCRQSDGTSFAYSNEVTATTLPGPIFHADFSDNQIPSQLEVWKNAPGSLMSVAVANQRLELTSHNGSGEHYGGLLHPGYVDLRDGIAQMRVDQFLAAHNAAEVELAIGEGDLHDWDNRTAYLLRINGSTPGIAADYVVNGEGDWGDLETPVSAPLWVRIRHSSAERKLYFEASEDGAIWEVYAERTLSLLFPIHRCQVLWMAGTYSSAPQTTARLDDLRVYGRTSIDPPAALTGLSVEGQSLTWSPSARATSYRIERRRVL